MAKILYLLLVLLVTSINTFAQTTSCWALTFDGNDPSWAGIGNPVIQSAVATNDGVVVAGTHFQNLWTGRNGLNAVGRTTGGGTYVAKYDFNGNIVWIDYGLTPNYEMAQLRDAVTSVTADDSGNLYICGLQSYNARFYYKGGTASIRISVWDSTSAGYFSPYFVAKLNKNGDVVWNHGLSSLPQHIVYDHHGRLILQGLSASSDNYYYRKTDTTFTFNSNTSGRQASQYLYWIDTTGQLEGWTSINGGHTIKVKTANDGSVFVLGNYDHELTLYDRNATTSRSFYSFLGYGGKCFLAKYDSSGKSKWCVYSRLSLNDEEGPAANCLDIDRRGNAYFTAHNNEFYLYDSMYFFNDDSSIITVPRRAYNLFCIDSTGKLKWQTFGGIEIPTGLLVSDSQITVAGHFRGKISDYLAPVNDTFYSAKNNIKYWLPHQTPSFALAYYDTTGTIRYAARQGIPKLPLQFTGAELEITNVESGALFLYGNTNVYKTVFFSDTLNVNGDDGVLMKVTPGVCDTLNMPPLPARVYIKQPYNALCKGDTFTLYDTVIAKFDTSNIFEAELFDYPNAGNRYRLVLDSAKGQTVDSFRCTIPSSIPTGIYAIRIKASNLYYHSQLMKVVITGPVLPAVGINPKPGTSVIAGTQVTFTAYPTYPGDHPQYFWFINNKLVNGANGSIYITDSLHNNDDVRVTLVSDYRCRTIDTVVSSSLVMKVTGVIELPGAKNPVQIFPNPSEGIFNIKGNIQANSAWLDLHDLLGRRLWQRKTDTNDGWLNVDVSLPQLSTGIYILRITANGSSETVRLHIR